MVYCNLWSSSTRSWANKWGEGSLLYLDDSLIVFLHFLISCKCKSDSCLSHHMRKSRDELLRYLRMFVQMYSIVPVKTHQVQRNQHRCCAISIGPCYLSLLFVHYQGVSMLVRSPNLCTYHVATLHWDHEFYRVSLTYILLPCSWVHDLHCFLSAGTIQRGVWNVPTISEV